MSGDQQFVLECCITIAGNMRLLGLEERYVVGPRMMAAGLRSDPQAMTRNFKGDPDQLRTVRAYFRLASLISDCLALATLPGRESYLQRLFERPNALLPT